jgi:predicted restriction endonuclease
LLREILNVTPGKIQIYTYVGSNSPNTENFQIGDTSAQTYQAKDDANIFGNMEQRLAWQRVNQGKFRQLLIRRFEGRCAVHGIPCNGLLIASHIYPWRLAGLHQRVDVNNGLLLSAPLDALFDQGLISFDDDGKILISSTVSQETRSAFGLTDQLRIRLSVFHSEILPDELCVYLAKHREIFKF